MTHATPPHRRRRDVPGPTAVMRGWRCEWAGVPRGRGSARTDGRSVCWVHHPEGTRPRRACCVRPPLQPPPPPPGPTHPAHRSEYSKSLNDSRLKVLAAREESIQQASPACPPGPLWLRFAWASMLAAPAAAAAAAGGRHTCLPSARAAHADDDDAGDCRGAREDQGGGQEPGRLQKAAAGPAGAGAWVWGWVWGWV